MPGKRGTLAERLDRHLDKSGECWLWTGFKTNWGYGTISDGNGKKIPTHRAAWIVKYGTIPEGMLVLHKCDIRACCNPDHLHIGTHLDNMRDMSEHGHVLTGEDNNFSKLTASEVIEIRAMWNAGSITQREIAKEYGVTRAAIGYIVRRDVWQHI